MCHLDLTLPTPAENLALDEALLLEAEAGRGGEVLRFWELPNHAVVLGSGGRLQEDVDEAACRADGVPILRRCSGGGTVLLGPGCFCFSLVLDASRPPLNDLSQSYRYILGRVRDALRPLAPRLELAGTSDLAQDQWKLSGNAQRRLRNHLLHHGTLLYGFDIALLGRYLKVPQRQPEYRRHRDHPVFVRNVSVEAPALRTALKAEWVATTRLEDWPRQCVADLVEAKYGRAEWVQRR